MNFELEWSEYFEKYPSVQDFFTQTFSSYADFEEKLEIYQDDHYLKLTHRSSLPIKYNTEY